MSHQPELNAECTCEFCQIYRANTRIAELEEQSLKRFRQVQGREAELVKAEERIEELEAKLKAQVDSDEIDWAECRARIAELEASLNFLGWQYAGVESTSHGFQLERDRYREALDKLARLGNEPHLGNSIGNDIAREALGL